MFNFFSECTHCGEKHAPSMRCESVPGPWSWHKPEPSCDCDTFEPEPYRAIPNAELFKAYRPVRMPETAQNGLWYCYDKQAWIRDGIVQACGHTTRGAVTVCYACEHAGEHHGCCAGCH